MMNAAACELSVLAPRTQSPIRGSVVVPDFWQMALSMQKAIYHCCLGCMNGNAADAEDAVQDVLIHASQQYPKHAGKIKNFTAWMLQVTLNFCRTRIRKLRKLATGVDDIELVTALGGIDRYSDDDLPEHRLVSDEESAKIDSEIASLPDTLRETYSLHYYEQLTNTEIADRVVTKCPKTYTSLTQATKIQYRRDCYR
ncbi:MAG: RNA polymerase sigma factor [Hormoscilla sp.]